jgi:hypothetical protein
MPRWEEINIAETLMHCTEWRVREQSFSSDKQNKKTRNIQFSISIQRPQFHRLVEFMERSSLIWGEDGKKGRRTNIPTYPTSLLQMITPLQDLTAPKVHLGSRKRNAIFKDLWYWGFEDERSWWLWDVGCVVVDEGIEFNICNCWTCPQFKI